MPESVEVTVQPTKPPDAKTTLKELNETLKRLAAKPELDKAAIRDIVMRQALVTFTECLDTRARIDVLKVLVDMIGLKKPAEITDASGLDADELKELREAAKDARSKKIAG